MRSLWAGEEKYAVNNAPSFSCRAAFIYNWVLFTTLEMGEPNSSFSLLNPGEEEPFPGRRAVTHTWWSAGAQRAGRAESPLALASVRG